VYIEALAKIRKDALENASTDLILVGCGDYTLLKEYISADPSLTGCFNLCPDYDNRVDRFSRQRLC